MQKVLLASTALVMTTGWAMADVDTLSPDANLTFEGEAQMGIGYTDGNADDDYEFEALSAAEVEFQFSAMTGTGLTFGANFTVVAGTNVTVESVFNDADGDAAVDFDDLSEDPQNFSIIGDPDVYVSGAFGTLTIGTPDNAVNSIDVGLEELGVVGLGIDDIAEDHYDTVSANVTYVSPEFNGFAFAASYNLVDEAEALDEDWLLAVAYGLNGIEVSAGYGNDGDSTVDDNADFWHVGLGYTDPNGVFSVGAIYNDHEDFDEAWGVDATYTVDALTFTAVYAEADLNDETGYGIEVGYDLGAGATLIGAIAKYETDTVDETIGNFGIDMQF